MSAPPWLNQDEMDFWRSYVVSTALVRQHIESDLKSEHNLTFDDYEVLVHLSEADHNRLRMSDLSERLIHSHSRLTQRVNRLEKKGLVTREKCSEDARVTYAVITKHGLAAIVAAAPDHVVSVRNRLLDHLEPSEIDVLTKAFGRVIRSLRQPDRTP